MGMMILLFKKKTAYEMRSSDLSSDVCSSDRLQLECAGRDWCDFAVLDRDGKLHISRLHRDPSWLATNLSNLEAFMAAYDAALAAPDEHLSDKSADMSDDEGWGQIAGEYSEACRRESEEKAEAEGMRDQLIEGRSEEGRVGIKVASRFRIGW